MDSKVKFFILILFLSVFAMQAQEGWYYQIPHGMRDVQFVASNKIVAVGRGIWISNDIQANWKGVYPGYDQEMNAIGYNKWLTAVDFPTSSVGYAVGSSPNVLIVKSDDGGNNWKQLDVQVDWNASELKGVKFIDSQLGFAVGYANTNTGWKGVILKTTDGGNSWGAYYPTFLCRAIEITSNNTIWVAGGSQQLAKSTDNGNSWTEIDVSGGSGSYPNCVDLKFKDNDNGILHLMDVSKLFRTTDGGQSWELVETGIDGTSWQIQYFDDGTVYTVLQDNSGGSAFYKSTNDGNSWTLVHYSEDPDISGSFTFLTKDFGIFDGSTGGSSSSFFKITTDGGTTFESYNGYLQRLFFIPNTTSGWASGSDEHIYKTADGKNWAVQKMIDSDGYKINGLLSMQFINENLGFAIGSLQLNSTTSARRLMKTTDGGANWSSYELDYGPYGLYFLDNTFGWVVGYQGSILKTLDGGATWGPQSSGTTATLLNVFFYDEQLGWAVGEGNTLLKTTNGGLLWEQIDMSAFSEYSINSITSYGGEICYLEGSDYMLKSANAGDTWSAISKPYTNSSYDYQKMIPISDTELYTYFGNGIYHSNNGGNSWTLIKENSKAIYPQTWENIWAASDGILYTENAGIVGIEEVQSGNEIVNKFKLEQNYPNPFNPSTTIEYSLSNESWVTLKVYDVLGREVAELVNDFKKSGIYKINFNAEELSSGVYFYTLKTHNNSISQKMLLLK